MCVIDEPVGRGSVASSESSQVVKLTKQQIKTLQEAMYHSAESGHLGKSCSAYHQWKLHWPRRVCKSVTVQLLNIQSVTGIHDHVHRLFMSTEVVALYGRVRGTE